MAEENKKKKDSAKASPSLEVAEELKTKIDRVLKLPISEISVIGLVDDMLAFAYNSRASDIHTEPFEDRIVVRLRIDGILHDFFILPKIIQSEIVTRIKVLSGLRTDEHQAAQDGRFKAKIKNPLTEVDIRVSIVPTYHGENAEMRLLVEQAGIKIGRAHV